jgi:Zn finger protein HypA/HybF involved in hydrogenase expression
MMGCMDDLAAGVASLIQEEAEGAELADIECARCGERGHTALWHAACMVCGSKDHLTLRDGALSP